MKEQIPSEGKYLGHNVTTSNVIVLVLSGNRASDTDS